MLVKRGRSLLKRLAALADDPRATLTDEDLAQVADLLDDLGQFAGHHRESLDICRAGLGGLAGLTLDDAVTRLGRRSTSTREEATSAP